MGFIERCPSDTSGAHIFDQIGSHIIAGSAEEQNSLSNVTAVDLLTHAAAV
jgi:hypothetical protein